MGTHPVEPIIKVAGGMASTEKRSERGSGSRPSAKRVQPRSSAGVPGGRSGVCEGDAGRVEAEVDHLHDADMDAARQVRWEADAALGSR